MKIRDSASPPPWHGVPPTGPILRVSDAARYLGLSVARYYELASSPNPMVPAPLKIGRRASGIPLPWLDSLIAARAAEIAQ